MFTKVVPLVFLALPFITQYASAAKCSRRYVVKDGDFCDRISQENGVSTYQLAVVNHGVMDCAKLHPGQDICLGTEGDDCNETYIVKHGDTCNGIQAKTGINATLLHTNNPQIDEKCTIYIGEVLCAAKVPTVPKAPSGGVSSVVVRPSTAVLANSHHPASHPHHPASHPHHPPSHPHHPPSHPHHPPSHPHHPPSHPHHPPSHPHHPASHPHHPANHPHHPANHPHHPANHHPSPPHHHSSSDDGDLPYCDEL